MPVTRNLQSSVNFSRPFIGYQPAAISNDEPALTAANLVKQAVLGPPMSWAWNRDRFIFITQTAQDYIIPAVADIGFLEKVWVTDTSGNVKEIPIKTSLAAESAKQRPSSASLILEADDGTPTLRLNTVPDEAYIVEGFFQREPTLMTSLAATWGPIPDRLGYIYDWGFLSFIALLTKDSRAAQFGQRFVAHLLGAQDGLTALQRNIFLASWLEVMTQQERATANTQQGVAARQL
jgi:hypothetical protein